MFVDHPRRTHPGRIVIATAAMAAVGGALPLLAPDPVGAARSLTAVQHLADTAGADAVVLRVAGLLAWAVWAWGALGLGLTACSALPGLAGALARALLHGVLPAGCRRAASLALGVGIGLNGTVVAGTVLAAPALAAVPVTAPTAPDWPTVPAATPAAPDWPAPAAARHVVVRGDCLWRIAEADLASHAGRPTDAEIAGAVRAWWSANAAVVGPDPDLLLPGQLLDAPVTPGVDR
jgi:nucleoid-associated protein YgaU